jgi:hypothetical protein
MFSRPRGDYVIIYLERGKDKKRGRLENSGKVVGISGGYFTHEHMGVVVFCVEPEYHSFTVGRCRKAIRKVGPQSAGIYPFVGSFRLFDQVLFCLVHKYSPVASSLSV